MEEFRRLIVDSIVATSKLVPLLLIIFAVGYFGYSETLDFQKKGLERLRTLTALEFRQAAEQLSTLESLVVEVKRVGDADPLTEKREKFLSINNVTFHYRNESNIKRLHNDSFKEATIVSIIQEVVSETGGDVSATLPAGIIGAKFGAKNLNKLISEIKLPDSSLNEMFLRWQRKTILDEQVTIGLELLEVERAGLEDFERLLAKINDYGIQIDEEVFYSTRSSLKEKSAEKTLIKLENITDMVILEGPFLITEYDSGTYEMIFTHPVSDFYQRQGDNITISFLLPHKDIQVPYSANYAESVGTTVNLKVYAEVWQSISRKEGRLDLRLIPLAVY